MTWKIVKTVDINEASHLLNGGIIGGNVASGIVGLVGKVLTFTTPSGNHTFTTQGDTTRPPDVLLLKDIKTQLEAAISGLKVMAFGGKIAFIQSTPTGNTELSANSEVAKTLLGFPLTTTTKGQLVNKPGAAAPSLEHVETSIEGALTLYIFQ